ncbi:TPA: hypothetical protein DDZ86_00195 [Candidatus Dependentiae bacterium]|nr:MAG: hypothetical protein UW09_C0002G0082 [candidate division TM6 bacterium GW2011_GWF2_43_87]HBL98048.1 hypothetical protein [Candidatus Dependentiae bacterium]
MLPYHPIVFITLLLATIAAADAPYERAALPECPQRSTPTALIKDFLNPQDQCFILSVLKEIANLELSIERNNLLLVAQSSNETFGQLPITALLNSIEEAGGVLRHPPYARSISPSHIENLAKNLILCGTIASQNLDNPHILSNPHSFSKDTV